MKLKMIQVCAMGLLALVSISVQAQDQNQKDQNDQETTKSWIALGVGAASAVPTIAGTAHFYKKANKAAEKGMSLEAYTNKKLRSDLLKEEEAAASKFKSGMVLSVLVPATTIVGTMNLLGLKQSDEKVSKRVEKATATTKAVEVTPEKMLEVVNGALAASQAAK